MDRPPPADVKGNVIDPSRNVEIAVLTNTPSVCPLRPSHRQPRASLFTATFLSAVNKDRFGLRVDRLRPPACPPLFPDTAPSSRCRARCLNLRSQTISAFPFRCLIPTPPASLRRRAQLHFNPVRNLRLLFRLVNADLLLSELRSARSPYTRLVALSPQTTKAASRLPTHRGIADGISTHGNPSSIVRDATLNALLGRED